MERQPYAKAKYFGNDT